MKKINAYLFSFFIACLFSACSTENEEEGEIDAELNVASVMVDNSPWEFDRYELDEIIDLGDSMFTQSEIENDITNSIDIVIRITFNDDGTGSSVGHEGDTSNFEWEIFSDNNLRLNFLDGGEVVETEEYTNLLISDSELKFNSNFSTFDSNVDFNIRHSGALVFE